MFKLFVNLLPYAKIKVKVFSFMMQQIHEKCATAPLTDIMRNCLIYAAIDQAVTFMFGSV